MLPQSSPDGNQGMSKVEFSNTAINMISSLHGSDQPALERTITTIKKDLNDSTRVKKLKGYPNVYVARGDGLRIVFRKAGDSAIVTSVATS